ncbi:MAG TPA: class I SAM-dependent methyltransferase [Thermoanaerobaculia bacterium]
MSSQDFWDREVSSESFHATNWMLNPTIHEYINASIGTAEHPLWPLDWFQQWLGQRHFARALSVGCGTGALERDLVRRNLCERVDAFDGSLGSLAIAREEARRSAMDRRIGYFASDFNRPVLPRRRYDLVLIHQAMHHVAKLEKLLRAILLALKPDGLLYLDEYIGPSRHEWTEERYIAQRKFFATIPRECLFVPVLPYPIVPQDPSEAFRSSEVVPQLEVGFDLVAFRGYGGNLLAPIVPAVDWKLAPKDLLERLIQSERDLLARGEPPFHAVIVARPKRGRAKRLASWRYFAEPKLKRILRGVRSSVFSFLLRRVELTDRL